MLGGFLILAEPMCDEWIPWQLFCNGIDGCDLLQFGGWDKICHLQW